MHGQGCISWDGNDENFWPVPPGTYGLKGIMQNVSLWGPDGKHHAVVPVFNGAIGPVPVNKALPPENQTFMVEGDPVGSSFTAIATNENFKDQPGRFANLYNSYLENAFNNFMIDLNKPHGPDQRVWRWDDAGIGGGTYTATNGR